MDHNLLRRCGMRFLLILAFGFAHPISAHAQPAGTLSVQVSDIADDDREIPMNGTDITSIPLGIDHCRRNAVTTIQIRNIPREVANAPTVLDVWRGAITQSCNSVAERNPPMGMSRTCVPLLSRTITGAEMNVMIPVRDLVNCAEDVAGERRHEIFFLAGTDNETVEEIGTNWGAFQIAIDTEPPGAVTTDRTNTAAGESQITIEWTGAPSGLNVFHLYGVAGACNAMTDPYAGGTIQIINGRPHVCPASTQTTDGGMDAAIDASDASMDMPMPDMSDADAIDASDASMDMPMPDMSDAPTAEMTVDMPSDTNMVDAGTAGCVALAAFSATAPGTSNSYDLDPDELGLVVAGGAVAGESEATIYVVAVDQALNESPVAVTCVERVETMGYCDRLAARGMPCDNNCSCSAPGVGPSVSWGMVGISVGLLGVLFWRRRRGR